MTTPTLVPYPEVIVPELATDGSICYTASHPDLPGCEVSADDEGEALELLKDAREAYLTALDAMGIAHPEPGLGAMVTWTVVSADKVLAGVPSTIDVAA